MKILIGAGAVISLIVVSMIIRNNMVPKNLGISNGKLAEMPKKPNAVSSQTQEEDKKVEPFEFIGTLEETKEKIIKSIKEYGGYDIIKNDRNYLYVVFTTGKMKFRDDAEFYFDEDERVIHFRSASRVGYSDMGLNRERYNKIREIYNN